MPVILAVAADDSIRTALDALLRGRFASDYAISVNASCAAALERLAALRSEGEQVALVIAPFRMPDGDGIPFLIDAHELHPSARRVLILDVGDVSAADELSQALTLAHVDAYFGQPWASPEEEVYPVLGEALRVWACEHQPRFEKAVIIDVRGGARGTRLRGWLERNVVATSLLAADNDRARALLAEHGVEASPLPVAVLYDGRVLLDPVEDSLAEALGARTRPARERYDLAIVGAGPAGLAAAVYAGSEGLRAIVIEHDAVGGQAGTSAKIRNYLGFPWGVGGADLTDRASRQAEQLGAEFVIARRAESLRATDDACVITLSNGDDVTASTIVLAGGVTYRRLGVPEVDALVGAGVFYGAGASEARSMGGLDAFVLGGGNSAGQAAAHLANAGARVTVLIRGASLAASMSDYLVRELDAAPNLTVRVNTEVVGAGTGARLETLELRDGSAGTTETVRADALFVFIGARPHTDWLAGALALDDAGFVLTGPDLLDAAPDRWPLERAPSWLETSMPGVFAAGDIRHGSIKRVAAAVGEGSTAAMLVREQLGPDLWSIGARLCEHMFVSGRATILHADLDAFYASVEQRDDPRLRGRPVIVGGGVVLAASYEARACGVRTAMGGRQALALCPRAIVVPPRMDAYSEASNAVFDVFRDTTPLVEGLSIDEAFLDVGGLLRVSGTPTDIAVQLRGAVRERVGLVITVGVARTKFLAKVASAVAKPDGLLVVPPERELDFLHPLPVVRLWGVGPVTAGKLHERGIDTVGEVARLGERVLVALLGKGAGRHLHALAHNHDPRPVQVGRRRRSIGSQRALGRSNPSLADIDAALVALVDRVTRRLRTADRVCRTVVLRLRFEDFTRATRSHSLSRATSHTATILATARGLLVEAAPLIERRGCTLIGVALANLDDDDVVQLALPFGKSGTGALDATLDDVRERFGAAAVTRAVLLGRDPGLSVPLLPD